MFMKGRKKLIIIQTIFSESFLRSTSDPRFVFTILGMYTEGMLLLTLHRAHFTETFRNKINMRAMSRDSKKPLLALD